MSKEIADNLKRDRDWFFHTWEGFKSTLSSAELCELDRLLFEAKIKPK